MRHDLRQSKSFSFLGLLLAIGGAVIGTAVPAFLGEGPVATLIGAVVLSLLTSLGLAGAESGTATGVKTVITLLLATGAVLVTVGGITLADLVRDQSLSGDTQKTFPVAADAAKPPKVKSPITANAGIAITGGVTCGTPAVGKTENCQKITVSSTGSESLKVTGYDYEGANPRDFSVASKGTTCILGAELKPKATCMITVAFKPTKSGARSAELIVHQNLPGDASSVNLAGGSSTSTPSPPSSSSSVVTSTVVNPH
jgi:hypothetical protein